MFQVPNSKFYEKGFTLIELLVVIAIIGLLSSIVLVSLNAARGKARDAVRKQDLKEIHKALEMYYLNHDQYPNEDWCDSSIGSCGHGCPCDGTDWTYTNYIGQKLKNEGLMMILPKDPINNTTYYYWYEPNCNQGVCSSPNRGCCDYTLGCRLEGGGSLSITSLEN